MPKKIFSIISGILLAMILVFLASGIYINEVFAVPPEAPDCTTYCRNITAFSPPSGEVCFCNPLKAGTISELIAALADLIFYIGLALVTLMIIIGGIMLILAGGDPNKVIRAKRLFFWTAIGAAIVVLAKGVSGVIKYILGGG